jgi:hypothetical protein
MKPISTTVWIEPPSHIVEGQALPRVLHQFTLEELCRAAKIVCRVSGAMQDVKRVILCAGDRHFHVPSENGLLAYVGGLGRGWKLDRRRALRVLEVLAFGFHDYEARECVCHRGFFVTRKPEGRPALLGRPRTAAERMRDMRARRAA